jgi:hypothetical protein
MIPATRKPSGTKIGVPIEDKLKPGWRLDTRRGVLESARGERFSPRRQLPKGTRTVRKVPQASRAETATASRAERDLQRYVQVILPPGERPADHLAAVRRWPGVEAAHIAPDVSLPGSAGLPRP